MPCGNGRVGRLKTYVRPRAGTETDGCEKPHVRPFLKFWSTMNRIWRPIWPNNIQSSQLPGHVRRNCRTFCPMNLTKCPNEITKLANILSDELDKMSRRNNEIGEHFVRWTWQNVPTKLANILSDELDKISDEITKLSLSQTQKNRYPKLRKRFLFLNCKYTFDPCFILDVYLNCFFRNSMIKHQIQCLQKCQKLKYLNRQK